MPKINSQVYWALASSGCVTFLDETLKWQTAVLRDDKRNSRSLRNLIKVDEEMLKEQKFYLADHQHRLHILMKTGCGVKGETKIFADRSAEKRSSLGSIRNQMVRSRLSPSQNLSSWSLFVSLWRFSVPNTIEKLFHSSLKAWNNICDP